MKQEGGREREREGGRDGGREGGREKERERGREGGKEGEWEEGGEGVSSELRIVTTTLRSQRGADVHVHDCR